MTTYYLNYLTLEKEDIDCAIDYYLLPCKNVQCCSFYKE
jgi:hypothetical protein